MAEQSILEMSIENGSTQPAAIERCLTFDSGDLTMFISTEYVTEIINNQSITYLPLLPPFIKGIINLRGQILPVVDIRLYMGKPETVYDSHTCIIVLNVNSISLGIIVDSVQKVVDIDLNQVHPIPLKRQQKLLNGMIKMESGKVLMSFDSEALATGY
ncbi:MAG: chemotaxis protein CheW [Lachnospiraceae bacterium]|nr:chemotaxis protein CheW [Lachnospiraceae bacterium]